MPIVGDIYTNKWRPNAARVLTSIYKVMERSGLLQLLPWIGKLVWPIIYYLFVIPIVQLYACGRVEAVDEINSWMANEHEEELNN